MVILFMRDVILKGFFCNLLSRDFSVSLQNRGRSRGTFLSGFHVCKDLARISQGSQLRAIGFSTLASRIEQSGRETPRDEVGFLKCKT